jgi:hypothetical protein
MGFSTDASKTPTPPKVFPVDLNATENAATQADITGYSLSDADFASRFPGLVQTRDTALNQAYNELTGPLDPTVQNTFQSRELGNSLSAFGGGSEKANVTGKGSIGKNSMAAGFGRDVMSYQDYARNNLENAINANPERAIGLSGSGATNLAIANTTNLNQANQLAYAASIAQQNANIQAANAKKAAEVGAGASLVGGIISKL